MDLEIVTWGLISQIAFNLFFNIISLIPKTQTHLVVACEIFLHPPNYLMTIAIFNMLESQWSPHQLKVTSLSLHSPHSPLVHLRLVATRGRVLVVVDRLEAVTRSTVAPTATATRTDRVVQTVCLAVLVKVAKVQVKVVVEEAGSHVKVFVGNPLARIRGGGGSSGSHPESETLIHIPFALIFDHVPRSVQQIEQEEEPRTLRGLILLLPRVAVLRLCLAQQRSRGPPRGCVVLVNLIRRVWRIRSMIEVRTCTWDVISHRGRRATDWQLPTKRSFL